MKRNPDALVVATGCYATVVSHRFPIENVLVVKNRDKDRLVEIVNAHLRPQQRSDHTLDSFRDSLLNAARQIEKRLARE